MTWIHINFTVRKDDVMASSDMRENAWCILLHINDRGCGRGLQLESGKGVNATCFQRIGVFEIVSGPALLKPLQDCTHSTITIIELAIHDS